MRKRDACQSCLKRPGTLLLLLTSFCSWGNKTCMLKQVGERLGKAKQGEFPSHGVQLIHLLLVTKYQRAVGCWGKSVSLQCMGRENTS